MKTMAVGELKAHFSSVLDEIKAGHPIAVGYGKSQRKIAVLVPYPEFRKLSKRKLGILSDRGSCRFQKDFTLSDEELVTAS
jgi:antitoxin (DNA-binding transcriptional repressor) of toxin-antitoxin stability system